MGPSPGYVLMIGILILLFVIILVLSGRAHAQMYDDFEDSPPCHIHPDMLPTKDPNDFYRCCNCKDCYICDIEITPDAILVNGEPTEVTGYEAIRDVEQGDNEWCCRIPTYNGIVFPHHCLFRKREPQWNKT